MLQGAPQLTSPCLCWGSVGHASPLAPAAQALPPGPQHDTPPRQAPRNLPRGSARHSAQLLGSSSRAPITSQAQIADGRDSLPGLGRALAPRFRDASGCWGLNRVSVMTLLSLRREARSWRCCLRSCRVSNGPPSPALRVPQAGANENRVPAGPAPTPRFTPGPPPLPPSVCSPGARSLRPLLL